MYFHPKQASLCGFTRSQIKYAGSRQISEPGCRLQMAAHMDMMESSKIALNFDSDAKNSADTSGFYQSDAEKLWKVPNSTKYALTCEKKAAVCDVVVTMLLGTLTGVCKQTTLV